MEDLYKFLIIEINSGLCIFDQTFKSFENQFDGSLLSGYLFAILTISQELTEDEIEFIKLKNLKILYNLSQKFLMILIASNELNVDYVQAKLTILQEKFRSRYEHLFQDEFSGNVTPFHSFAQVVEHELERETKHFRYINKRANQLQEFFDQSKIKWQDFQDTLKDRTRKLGQWTNSKHCNIDYLTELDLVKSRKEFKEHTPNEKKNKWV
jgi:hypothetical protein